MTIESSTYQKRIEPRRLAADAPNILIILIDDVGNGTPSTYGGEINTPTLSRIAGMGVSYNRFHSTAMCSPTRAALLTGCNHTRVGNGQIAAIANDFDGFSGVIPKTSATMAEVLKAYGWDAYRDFGGTRNPLVVSWPKGIKPDKAMRSQFTHCVDIAPTLYELLNITPPKTVNGHEQIKMDGHSFAATFDKAAAPATNTEQFFDNNGSRAIYKDGWMALRVWHLLSVESKSFGGADEDLGFHHR